MGWFDSIMDVATGGAYSAVQGDTKPFTDNALWYATGGTNRAIEAIKGKGGKNVIGQLMYQGDPGGLADRSIVDSGKALGPKSARDVGMAINIIGGLLAPFTFGASAGAAGAISSRLQGGSLGDAGKAGAVGYAGHLAGSAVSPYVSGAVGSVAGPIIGGAAGGAAGNAAGNATSQAILNDGKIDSAGVALAAGQGLLSGAYKGYRDGVTLSTKADIGNMTSDEPYATEYDTTGGVQGDTVDVPIEYQSPDGAKIDIPWGEILKSASGLIANSFVPEAYSPADIKPQMPMEFGQLNTPKSEAKTPEEIMQELYPWQRKLYADINPQDTPEEEEPQPVEERTLSDILKDSRKKWAWQLYA